MRFNQYRILSTSSSKTFCPGGHRVSWSGCRHGRRFGGPLPASRDLSNCNLLNLIERNLIVPPVVKLRRPRRFMVGNLLRYFQFAAVL